MKRFLSTLALLLTLFALPLWAAPISQTVASINADAAKPGGPAKVLQSISASVHVPVPTLEKQKAKTGLTYGDLFAAHSIAKASGKSFEDIVAQKTKGASWDKVANDNNTSLGGNKKKTVAAAGATPTATPHQKSLAEEQRERFSLPHAITNAPPKPKKP